jgi:hypothetical protein
MADTGKVNLARLSYVIYEHSDLATFNTFSKDFGFESAGKSDDGHFLFRGYGLDPYIYVARQAQPGKDKKFHGAGFIARTSEDFDRACRLEGAQVEDISHYPGGGKMVSVPDPNGYAIQIIYGQEDRSVPRQGVSSVYDGQPNVNGAITKARKGKLKSLARLFQGACVDITFVAKILLSSDIVKVFSIA